VERGRRGRRASGAAALSGPDAGRRETETTTSEPNGDDHGFASRPSGDLRKRSAVSAARERRSAHDEGSPRAARARQRRRRQAPDAEDERQHRRERELKPWGARLRERHRRCQRERVQYVDARPRSTASTPMPADHRAQVATRTRRARHRASRAAQAARAAIRRRRGRAGARSHGRAASEPARSCQRNEPHVKRTHRTCTTPGG
jgi:hypothetical protein